MALSIPFSGWYQVRLATDPDPYDEPAGVTGWVRIVAGEPPLDRVIRFQPSGTFMRSHTYPEPQVGVRASTPTCSDPHLNIAGLAGAGVDLANNPVFEGRNHVIAQDGAEPIWPLHPTITGNGWQLGRPLTDTPDPDHPARTAFPPSDASQPTAEDLLQRFGLPLPGDVPAYVAAARDKLLNAANTTTDAVQKDNLQRRAQRLIIVAGQWMQWRADLTGTPTITTPPGVTPDQLNSASPWKLEMLSTGYCSDSMCALITGWLHLPLNGETLNDSVWKMPGPTN